jgi:hypothetical protein
MFYFIAFILVSSIGLKLIASVIFFIVNKWLLKKEKIKTKLVILKKQDIFFIYIALIAIVIGTAIQIYLSKVFFIFLINFQLIIYILIILIYVTIVSLSLYVLYSIIKSVLKSEKI